MNNLNSILIEGYMAKDPLCRGTPKGKLLVTFELTSERFFQTEDGIEHEVSSIEVETRSKLAEVVQNKGHKGCGIRVVGRLKAETWVDSERKEQKRTYIVAEHLEFRPEYVRPKSPEPVAIEDDDKATEHEITAEAAVQQPVLFQEDV
jgi:single-strand DNA-binding protein